ncbi:MAG: hypothetical protein ACPGVD_10165 [Flavobacteriales bacterium]
MKTNFRISILLVSILLGIGCINFSFKPLPVATLKYELGFSINPSAGTKVVNFAILGIDSATGVIIKKQPITEANFVMYSKGILKNKANPKGIDFFKEVGIDCGLILDDPKTLGGVLVVDTLWEEMKPICLPVWDIWKLRYSINPRYGSGATTVPEEDKGWAANRYRPSYKQTLYLKKYGFNHIADFCYGSKMYELFKDMQNPDWIGMYKELH